MMRIPKKTVKLFLVFGAVSFFLAWFFGLGHMGMAMSAEEQMSGCPFMDIITMCRMGLLEHITAWENIFSGVPQNDLFFLVTFLLCAFLLARGAFGFRRVANGARAAVSMVSPRHAVARFVFLPLQEAFASGIVHSKVF